VAEPWLTNNSTAARNIVWGWRCIFWGEIVDDVILENRQWFKKGIVSGNKKAQSVLGKKWRIKKSKQ
jgi:hypothetical protein